MLGGRFSDGPIPAKYAVPTRKERRDTPPDAPELQSRSLEFGLYKSSARQIPDPKPTFDRHHIRSMLPISY
ncbi:hypothetical protein HYN69_06630 [Gemmobacter aquarius]|uniref:Uncharacterized protein n=1 Tax=Paragemmobacter aquarius TaxID=2169400 RepID=A0A2S0UK84_9RHOB|nr:hypothetical protein [Gemmobacter aquarius]AWB48227.1 hypothetical protein HYN69_06630 [Gemmobacter aquarius]